MCHLTKLLSPREFSIVPRHGSGARLRSKPSFLGRHSVSDMRADMPKFQARAQHRQLPRASMKRWKHCKASALRMDQAFSFEEVVRSWMLAARRRFEPELQLASRVPTHFLHSAYRVDSIPERHIAQVPERICTLDSMTFYHGWPSRVCQVSGV